jgi:hypothetical protein
VLISAELRELIGRAERGDAAALPTLRAELDADPALWHSIGDLARRAEVAWVALIAGDDLALRESLLRTQAAARAALAGPAATPLARALAEAVLAASLQLHHATAARGRFEGEGAETGWCPAAAAPRRGDDGDGQEAAARRVRGDAGRPPGGARADGARPGRRRGEQRGG